MQSLRTAANRRPARKRRDNGIATHAANALVRGMGEALKLGELKGNPRNPRRISEPQKASLKASLERFGDLGGIWFNRRTQRFGGGHQRAGALPSDAEVVITNAYEKPTRVGTVAEGYVLVAGERFAYREVDWAPDFEEAANIAANKQGGEWDDEKLGLVLKDLDDELRALTGFTDEEIEALLPKLGAANDEDPDQAVEPPKVAKTQRGELWLLGSHRVYCGDSTDPCDVGQALGDRQPHLMVTDPPYGVDYKPEWRNEALGENGRSLGKVQNDKRADWTEAYALFPGSVAYIWHAGTQAHVVLQNLLTVGFVPISQIIWAKHHFALSRGDYHWQHEPCWYVVKANAHHHWQGARDQATVWEIRNALQGGTGDPDDAQTGHSTQKPIECMERPIRNNSTKAEWVYDPFLGSGSTLIAAERSGRCCAGLEIDPVYVDTILERWSRHTGKDPVREDGVKWSELKLR